MPNQRKCENDSSMERNVVIALGNPLLCDDSAALVALRLLKARTNTRNTDFVENYSSGMDLLPELIGRNRAIVMDAVCTGRCGPGTCLEFTLGDLSETRQARLVDTHGLNLATVFETGVRFGYPMPDHLTILGIEGRDFTSFREQPGEEVMEKLPEIVEMVERTLREWEEADAG